MTKKRLADLLREEVQKSPNEAVGETEATSNPSALEAASLETSSPEASSLEASATSPGSELIDTTPMPTPHRPTRTTKADLELMIAELQQELEAAQQNAAALQQQTNDLKADLQNQQAAVQKLQAAVEEIPPLKLALEQAKNDALLLAQTNERLIRENEALSKENTQLKSGLQNSRQLQTPQVQAQPQERQGQQRRQKLGSTQVQHSQEQAKKIAPPSKGDFESWCYD